MESIGKERGFFFQVDFRVSWWRRLLLRLLRSPKSMIHDAEGTEAIDG